MRSKLLPSYCTPGRPLKEVGGVIVHYFSARNVDRDRQFELEACRNLFLDLNRPKMARQWYMTTGKWPDGRMYASAHLLVGRDGETWKLVEYDQEAYHAGASILNGRPHCNRWTLGIELVGTITSGFTDEQYTELAKLLVDLRARYGFPRQNIAGHDTARWAALQAGMSADPKYDPSGRKDGQGDNFSWTRLWSLMDALEGATGDVGEVTT